MLALGGSLWTLAFADELGGISGTVVDAKTGQPVAHARLYYYRSPYRRKRPEPHHEARDQHPRLLQRYHAGAGTLRDHGAIPG